VISNDLIGQREEINNQFWILESAWINAEI